MFSALIYSLVVERLTQSTNYLTDYFYFLKLHFLYDLVHKYRDGGFHLFAFITLDLTRKMGCEGYKFSLHHFLKSSSVLVPDCIPFALCCSLHSVLLLLFFECILFSTCFWYSRISYKRFQETWLRSLTWVVKKQTSNTPTESTSLHFWAMVPTRPSTDIRMPLLKTTQHLGQGRSLWFLRWLC